MRTNHSLTYLFSLTKNLVVPVLALSICAETAHGGAHDPHGRRTEERHEMRLRAEELEREKHVLTLKSGEERPPEDIAFQLK